jgi:hypothetical protein
MHLHHLLKLLLLGGCFCCSATLIPAQEATVVRTPVSAESLDNLLQGRLYSPNYFPIKGSPFLTKDWSREDILVQGNPYRDVPVWYDIYIDDLIMLNQQEDNLYFIRLNREQVEHFSLGDRNFVNLVYSEYRDLDLRPGYYEIAFRDKLSYLVKRSLEVKEEDQTLDTYFSRNDRRYLIVDGELYPVQNRRSVLAAIGKSHKKALKGFMKKQRTGLKSATDETWLALVRLLNTLQPDRE